MIDFNKMMKLAQAPVLTDPLEIYKNLDLTASVSELRPVQEEVLAKWYKDLYEQKDIILKLHTGEGKTLVGLLMLLSRLNKAMTRTCPLSYQNIDLETLFNQNRLF